MRDHELHKVIGTILKSVETAVPGTRVCLDGACGGFSTIPYRIPGETHSNPSKMCQGDILILLDGQRRIEIEIEETDLRPLNLLAKAHGPRKCHYVERGIILPEHNDGVEIVHVIKTNSRKKLAQLRFVERWINEQLDVLGRYVYTIFHGTVEDFSHPSHRDELLGYVTSVLSRTSNGPLLKSDEG